MTNRKRIIAKSAVGLIIVLGALIFPLRVRDADREKVLIRDAQRLRATKRVFLDCSYRPFYDAELFSRRKPKWHVYSDVSLNVDRLAGDGFTLATKDVMRNLSNEDWYNENVLLEITDKDSADENTMPGLRFNVHHGTMGAQGYRMHIYRCLVGTFTRYSIEWVS